MTNRPPKLSLSRPAPRLTAPVVLGCLVALAICVPGAARASDKTLTTSLAKWSHRLAVDARGTGLSASRRHPRRMISRAQHFRADALRAQRAIAAQRSSTAKGRRAQSLAIAAFGDYAVVGREWTLSGQARLRDRKPIAARHATLAKRFASKGSQLLVAAGKQLR